jgi:putative PEP-CTERM system histidine kinase
VTPLMGPLEGVVIVLATLSSVALAGVALARRPRGRLQWSFALGMAGFALESLTAGAALAAPGDRVLWLHAVQVAGLALLLPWGAFVATLAYPRETAWPPGRRLLAAAGAATVLGAAAMVALGRALEVSAVPLASARLEPAGRIAAVVQLMATVAVLAGLEACLRTSRRETRWRIKHLLLGLGGIFLVRFYLLTHFLLFHVLLDVYLTIQAATLFLGDLMVGASLLRDRLLGVDLTVSRRILYRSVVLSVLGVYLFVVGALGWLLNRLGIPEQLFWGSVVIFVSALGLAAILLSENVRWRIKRFISLNFYRSKYDYREQWMAFTRRLGGSAVVTPEELAPELLGAVADAVGASRGLLYLLDEHDGRFELAAAVEVTRAPRALAAGSPLVDRLAGETAPLLVDGAAGLPALEPELAELAAEGGVAVPLRWRGALTGVIVLGPERTRASYTAEDVEFLATVGQQAAGAIGTAQLWETLARSREFEAFHRLTSFVIHDLKNSVAALSMLSVNALDNFDDPEFQRDALKTLSRTVGRMKALLARLSSTPETAPVEREPVDLGALVLEATLPVARNPHVRLARDLVPLPPILGNPDALLRVVQNLVANALEAISGEGGLTVRTRAEGGFAVLSVSDTGCGIDEEFLRKSLFAPFRTTKKGGWGIGLYQAKGIVEAHGGAVEVSSAVGEGTTFRVRLPLASSVEGSAA